MLSNDVAVGTSRAHSSCHVHRYEDDIVVEVECRLIQNGEERGFIHCDEPARFEMEVCLRGRLVDHLCIDLCGAVHIECYGPQDPRPLPTQRWHFDPCEYEDNCYTFVWDIPADYFCPPNDEDCGQVCCFVGTVTSFTRCGDPGHIGCMCRGPCVLIHRAPEHDNH